MDIAMSNDAAFILVLGAFACIALHWGGKIFYLALSRD